MPSRRDEQRRALRLAMLRAMGSLLPHAKLPTQRPARLLLVRPDHFGDMLLTTPTLRLLRIALPDMHISMLAGPWSQAVLAGNPNLDELLTCEFPGFTRSTAKPGGLAGPYRYALETAARLRGKYDAALILRDDHWWGALICALAGIPFRAGYDLPEGKPFLTHTLRYNRTLTMHQAERSLWLARACAKRWGAEQATLTRWYPSEFFYTEDDMRWADDWLSRQAGVEHDTPLVLLHPGAGADIKLWEIDKWIAVADTLQERHGVRIIVSGTPGEAAHAGAIIAGLKQRPFDAIGATTLGQLAALLSRCVLALGTDNGTMHLATALDVPSLRLYGPVDPIAFGPYTKKKERHRWLRTVWGCAPCGRLDYTPAEMRGHDCVRSIAAEAVVRQAERLILHSEPTKSAVRAIPGPRRGQ